MRLVLNGNINKLYVQTLCMLFFRGERFPENEENPRGILDLTTTDESDGISCIARLSYDDKAVTSASFVPFEKGEKYERTSKASIGKAVLEAGYKLTGRIIPWGTLTGIRPSKVTAQLLEEHTEDKVIDILQDKYLLSKQKAELSVRVAKNEMSILKDFDEKSCSMYISIPFCPTRCSYCSFISYATKKLFDLIPSYLLKLKEQIKENFKIINRLGLKLVTIYIGGGTPTILNENQLEELLKTVTEGLDGAKLLEFTLEGGRPDTITKEKLCVLKKYGIDRISINPQSLNDSVLEKIGRRHTVSDFFNAYKLVSDSGIEIVNTDLIAGLDGDSFDSFNDTVDKIISLNPHNVTVHSFSVKKSAQILKDDEKIYNKNEDYAALSVDYAYEALLNNGYEPYYMYRQKNTVSDLENVGYAKKDTFGIYNVLMMSDEHTVFSAGAGATTKLVKKANGKTEILRIFSHKYPYEYLQDNQSIEMDALKFFQGGDEK